MVCIHDVTGCAASSCEGTPLASPIFRAANKRRGWSDEFRREVKGNQPFNGRAAGGGYALAESERCCDSHGVGWNGNRSLTGGVAALDHRLMAATPLESKCAWLRLREESQRLAPGRDSAPGVMKVAFSFRPGKGRSGVTCRNGSSWNHHSGSHCETSLRFGKGWAIRHPRVRRAAPATLGCGVKPRLGFKASGRVDGRSRICCI